ncbi:hypothetical protein L211DRAFT_538124 [Terfezia boudieri ATCC MYA-4762]|uniref:Uncharacterized protein n=1 Tax=Terfezia boudieri ATCC MYA-4762 TaxID=1051890 RepID=A0A3N4LWW2_9PEZI|nr:hypothetical protein L211DRAFT_538124 [Terfezia boudieri ATCC MYA-4762]
MQRLYFCTCRACHTFVATYYGITMYIGQQRGCVAVCCFCLPIGIRQFYEYLSHTNSSTRSHLCIMMAPCTLTLSNSHTVLTYSLGIRSPLPKQKRERPTLFLLFVSQPIKEYVCNGDYDTNMAAIPAGLGMSKLLVIRVEGESKGKPKRGWDEGFVIRSIYVVEWLLLKVHG